MSRFRAFPYRGSLLRSQTGAVQEVSQSLQLVHTWHPSNQCLLADHATCHSYGVSQDATKSLANHIQEAVDFHQSPSGTARHSRGCHKRGIMRGEQAQ